MGTTTNGIEYPSDYNSEADIPNDLKKMAESIEEALSTILLSAHPVGSYYWSSSSTSPATLFGGIWVQVTDKFILAAGSSYIAGNTGGSATNKLTASQIPTLTGTAVSNGAHSHEGITVDGTTFSVNNGQTGAGYGADVISGYRYGTLKTASAGAHAHTVNITNSSQSTVNNMPPYEVAYCWKRTA